MMDLSPYIGRGFSPEIDRIIATVGVAGIDLQQVQSASAIVRDRPSRSSMAPISRHESFDIAAVVRC